MISPIKQPEDSSGVSEYAPPWARVAGRVQGQLLDQADFSFRSDHAVVQVRHVLPIEPGQLSEPATGGPTSLRLIALQMCAVSGFAALVAWTFLSLLASKPTTNEIVQVKRAPIAGNIANSGAQLPGPSVSVNPPQSPESAAIVPTAQDRARVAASAAGPAANTTAPAKAAANPAPNTAPAQAEAATGPTANTTAPPAEAAAGPAANTMAPPAKASANPEANTTLPRTETAAAPPANQPPPQAETASAAAPQAAAPRSVNHSVMLAADEIVALVRRGQDFIKTGDFASARLVLKRAADAGSAEAALALGATFDPLFIRRVGAIGIQPDIDRARQWYQKAADLGSTLASTQLANLPQGH